MEGKEQDQGARRRTEMRSNLSPQEEALPKQREGPKRPRGDRRPILFAFPYLCLCVCLVGVFFVYLFFLRSEPALIDLPIRLQALISRSAQQNSSDGPDTQTPLSLSLVNMAPLTELKTSVIKPGSGPTVAKGQRVTVHATGCVIQADGTTKKFWSTKDPGQQPFAWQAGLGQVIAGWDQGVLGMSLGETRMIYIPAKMGYGAGGFPAWGIPANADLQFEIECLQIQ